MIEDVNFDVGSLMTTEVYKNIYTVDLPKGLAAYAVLVEGVVRTQNITKVAFSRYCAINDLGL